MNWGVLGYGSFAPKFLSSVSDLDSQKIIALATRSNAEKATIDFPDARIYLDYEDLFIDPKVDIIYICTTHNFHKENVLKALAAKKHVICEKPMGLNESEAREMIQAAKRNNCFLMEGMWMLFLPAYRKLKEFIRHGGIGKVHYITADFGFPGIENKERLKNPSLAGGATYDVGVYPISLAVDFLGLPDQVRSTKSMTDQNVDQSTAISFSFTDGRAAHLHCSVGMHTSKKAIIYGSDGYIEIPTFWQMQSFYLHKDDGVTEYLYPFESTGYIHEIMAAVQAIKAGKIESDIWSHQHSLQNARLVDEILG